MNINRFKPYESTYIKVEMPLTDEILTAFEKSKYAYLLDDYPDADDNRYTNAYCTMVVVFDFVTSEVYFYLNTICRYEDEPSDITGTSLIDFDPETAEYFKQEAIKQLCGKFKAMQNCIHKPEFETISA